MKKVLYLLSILSITQSVSAMQAISVNTIDLTKQLFKMVKSKASIEEINKIINNGVDINNGIDKDGNTILMRAVYYDHYDACKLLIEKGANIEAKNKNGYTALLHAAAKGHIAICKILIDNGANLNVKANNGYTPLIHTTKNNYSDLCKLFNDTIIDAELKQKATPLMWAAHSGKYNECATIIKNGAKIHDLTNALIWAARKGHLTICELLIKNGADMNIQDIYGYTSLMCAIMYDYPKTCELIIK